MNLQEAYINGFVKRAAQYGFNELEAVDLLKQANDPKYKGVTTLAGNAPTATPPGQTVDDKIRGWFGLSNKPTPAVKPVMPVKPAPTMVAGE
jgi:hypothetical protein